MYNSLQGLNDSQDEHILSVLSFHLRFYIWGKNLTSLVKGLHPPPNVGPAC